jgi:hypothetical protein
VITAYPALSSFLDPSVYLFSFIFFPKYFCCLPPVSFASCSFGDPRKCNVYAVLIGFFSGRFHECWGGFYFSCVDSASSQIFHCPYTHWFWCVWFGDVVVVHYTRVKVPRASSGVPCWSGFIYRFWSYLFLSFRAVWADQPRRVGSQPVRGNKMNNTVKGLIFLRILKKFGHPLSRFYLKNLFLGIKCSEKHQPRNSDGKKMPNLLIKLFKDRKACLRYYSATSGSTKILVVGIF